jgi:transcriptional regulator with XRE-family HTH domain
MAVTTVQSFGARLRAARRAADITQEKLGYKVGCSPSHLCLIEKGIKTASPELRARLTRALNLGDAR